MTIFNAPGLNTIISNLFTVWNCNISGGFTSVLSSLIYNIIGLELTYNLNWILLCG